MTRLRHAAAILLALICLSAPAVSSPRGPDAARRESTPAPTSPALYTCPMHPDVKSDRPGVCIRCGMALAAPRDRERLEAAVSLETTPASPRSGQSVRLRFVFTDSKSGAPVRDFNVLHGMPFHLFIVSDDLGYFAHIHPVQQADGSFTIESVLPRAGRFELFSDFFPKGGAPQVVGRSLVTEDFPARDGVRAASRLEPDRVLARSVDGVRFELVIDPAQPVAGKPTQLKYSLRDEKTGAPVVDLQPYLGTWGHTVTLREDVTDFFHSHATQPVSTRVNRGPPVNEPTIAFNAVFARAGRYRIWSQFQRNGRILTVSFDVDVSRLERLARWDGGSWSPMAKDQIHGLAGAVRAMAVHGKDVYLGGDFTAVDGVRANRIAKWDGQRWSPLGEGVDGRIWSIAVDGNTLYVGGEFTAAGGRRAAGIARWDGRAWSSVGGGVEGCPDGSAPIVHALAVGGRVLYAGGQFCTAGGVSANGIAQWDGQAWRALAAGVRTGIYGGVVRALAFSGKDLYAGGQFVTAGETSAYNISRWDGRRWFPLGSGIRGHLEKVLAIAAHGRDVYVGGAFLTAGERSASNVAKWNGKEWSAMDVRPQDAVWAIATDERNVYLGGATFGLPEGVVTRGIVRWNQGIWAALGQGLGSGIYAGPIMAIAPVGDEVYVGGEVFSLAEDTPRSAGASTSPATRRSASP